MRSDGVEVAEQHDIPLGVCRVEVGQDLLDHPLRPAIGVCGRLLRALLGEGQGIGLAVDRGGGAEDDVLAAVVPHHVDEGQRIAEVVRVVLDRLRDRLSDCLEACEVDDTVDIVLVEDLVHRLAVIHIGTIEREVLCLLFADDRIDAVDDLLRGIGQIVHNNDLVAAVQELDDRVAADESCTAGDEDAGILRILLLAHARLLVLRADDACPCIETSTAKYTSCLWTCCWAGHDSTWQMDAACS